MMRRLFGRDSSPRKGSLGVAASSAGPPSLRRNFSWTLVGNIGYSACQWATLVVLARLASSADVGRFAFGLALAAPVFMLANLNLRGIQATDTRDRFSPGTYLGLRILAVLAAVGAIAVWTSLAVEDSATRWVVLAIAAAKAFESVSDVLFGFMQRHERMRLIGCSLLAKGALSLAAVTAAMLLVSDIAVASAAMASAWLVVLVVFDIPNARRIANESSLRPRPRMAPAFRAAPLVSLARTAAPLGLVMLLVSLNANIPRYALEHHSGVAELGVFAALTYLMVAGTTIVSALGQSASPRLANAFAAGHQPAFRALLRTLLFFAVGLGIVGIAAALTIGEPLLALLYGEEYSRASPVFVLVALASALTYVTAILGYATTAARVFHAQAPVLILVTTVVTIASIALVPRFGLHGAALALICGAFTQLVGMGALLALTTRRAQAVVPAASGEL